MRVECNGGGAGALSDLFGVAMKRVLFRCLLIAAVIAFSWSPVIAADPQLPEAAETFVQKFITMMDEGKFKESFELTAPVLEEIGLDVHAYTRKVSERESLGKAAARKLIEVETVKTYADLPEKEYLKIVYHTEFDIDPEAQEVIILDKVGEGYGVADYQIRFNRWPEAIKMIANGLFIVFFIMILLATITWSVGKIVQSAEKRKKANEKEKG